MLDQPQANTDRELWREVPGDADVLPDHRAVSASVEGQAMSPKANRPYFPNSKTKEWSQSWIKLCNLLSLSYDSDPQTIADNLTAGAYYRRMYQRSATAAASGSTPDTASSSAPTVDTPATAVRIEADG